MLSEVKAKSAPRSEVAPANQPPEKWTQATLGDLIKLEYGRSLPAKSRRMGTIPVYGSNGVVGWHDEALVTDGGIIVGRKGTAGSVTVSPDPFWPIDTTYYVEARETVEWGWLAALLHHARLNELNEATGVPGLNREKAYLHSVQIPSLAEQRRIAEVLRSVDEAIAAKTATLAAMKKFKRTCREAAVLRFLECPSTALESVLVSIDAGWSPACDNEPANEGEWSILKTSAVVWEGYDDNQNKRLPADLEPRPHLEVIADDVLITRAGPAERTGVVAIVRETDGKRMLSDKIIRLCVDQEKAVPLAIAEMLSSDLVQAELVRSKTGMAASQTNISQKIVLGLEVSLPSLEEQKDFANEMAALQDAIEVSETDLLDAQRLKSAIMSDLLAGRVRVPA